MTDWQPSKDSHLTITEQYKIIDQLEAEADAAPLREKILFRYGAAICFLPLGALYLMSWRAGFRGYSLYKYGRARLITLACGLVFPANGYMCHMFVNDKLREPFRPESAWYYGCRHAIHNQFGVFSNICGPLVVTFLFANKTNLLPIPDSMHKPGVREIAVKIFFQRVKPYTKNIALAALASTGSVFLVGLGSYIQSCNLLAKMGRKTLGEREK